MNDTDWLGITQSPHVVTRHFRDDIRYLSGFDDINGPVWCQSRTAAWVYRNKAAADAAMYDAAAIMDYHPWCEESWNLPPTLSNEPIK